MHEAGVKAFPAKTEGKGNVLMAPRRDGNVKVYDLTCSEIDWEIADANPQAYKAQLANDCTYGHIIAGAYMSADYADHMRNEDAIEDFSD